LLGQVWPQGLSSPFLLRRLERQRPQRAGPSAAAASEFSKEENVFFAGRTEVNEKNITMRLPLSRKFLLFPPIPNLLLVFLLLLLLLEKTSIVLKRSFEDSKE
jgi:hypothetical protein